jgi:hypothetical protein
MAKAKKVSADTIEVTEKTPLELLQDELSHWEKYLKDQGIDDTAEHPHKARVQKIRDEMEELS